MKKNSYLTATRAFGSLCAATILVSGGVSAQSGRRNSPEVPAWKQFHLNPATRVQLDFRNANVDAILQT